MLFFLLNINTYYFFNIFHLILFCILPKSHLSFYVDKSQTLNYRIRYAKLSYTNMAILVYGRKKDFEILISYLPKISSSLLVRIYIDFYIS